MSWDCGFKYLFALSPTLKAGVLCKLQGRDDIGRIELVQKLAKENCQFLQTDRKTPEKAEQVRHFLFGFFGLFLVEEGDLGHKTEIAKLVVRIQGTRISHEAVAALLWHLDFSEVRLAQ